MRYITILLIILATFAHAQTPIFIKMAGSTYSAQLRGIAGIGDDDAAGLTIQGVYDSQVQRHVFLVSVTGYYQLWYDAAGGSNYIRDAIYDGTSKGATAKLFVGQDVMNTPDSSLYTYHLSTQLDQYITAAGGGTITNFPDGVTIDVNGGTPSLLNVDTTGSWMLPRIAAHFEADTTIHPDNFTNKMYTALQRLALIDFVALSTGEVNPGMFESPGTPYAPISQGGDPDSNFVYIERAMIKAGSMVVPFKAKKSGKNIGWAIEVAPQSNGAMFQISNQGTIYDGMNGGTSGTWPVSKATWVITKEPGIDSVIVFSTLAANGNNGVQLTNWAISFDTTGVAAGDTWSRASFADLPNINDNFRANNIRVGHWVADSTQGAINVYANGGGGLGTANLGDLYFFPLDSSDDRSRWPLVLGRPTATGAINNLNITGTFKADATTGLIYFWSGVRGGFIENMVYETQSQFGYQRGPVDLFVTDATYLNGFNSNLHLTIGNLSAQSNDRNWDGNGAPRTHTLHLMRGDNYQDVPVGITILNGFLNLYNNLVTDSITGTPIGHTPVWSSEMILRNYTTTSSAADNRNPAANHFPRGFSLLSDKHTGTNKRTNIRIVYAGYSADSTKMYLQTADTTTGARDVEFWLFSDTTEVLNGTPVYGGMAFQDSSVTISISGGTAVKVTNGTSNLFTAGVLSGVTYATDGILAPSAGDYEIIGSLSIQSAGVDTIQAFYAINGVTQYGAHQTTTANGIHSISIGPIIKTLAATNKITLFVQNETSTNNFIVTDGTLSIKKVSQ